VTRLWVEHLDLRKAMFWKEEFVKDKNAENAEDARIDNVSVKCVMK